MANILTLSNIRKTYGTVVKTEVLHGINLDIQEHSFNAIIGQSGSGKSTLMNIIGTLDTPSEGTIKILNKEVSTMKPKELALLRNETIGFIFQHHYLLPEFTAIENILMPARIKKNILTKETLDYANELIDFVGLSHVKNNKATDMSGGQMQRVAIARALLNKPKIILADEPTGALDSDTTEQVYTLLREIHKQYQTTFIIITHDKKIAEKADRMIEIKDGHVILDITVSPKN
ncbi:ABC transporter ATP-binding protein [Liberiplasma polymorphum]|uniref:ABC transporter ATP-binding protein n=1 Tax=Liberiplasma polymorphum TaxID=3374570 RepID=UPI0037741124